MTNTAKAIKRRTFLLELMFLRTFDEILGTQYRKYMIPGNDSPITYLEECHADDFGE